MQGHTTSQERWRPSRLVVQIESTVVHVQCRSYLLLICDRQPSAADDAQLELVDTRKSISKYIRTRLSLGRSKLADQQMEPITPPGVFGVPLLTSIRYANVAISILNDDGNPYIYGYIQIMVAKTSVYLKEKGAYYMSFL
jgi:hypothetical protein